MILKFELALARSEPANQTRMIVFLTLVFLLSTQINHVICSLDRLKGLKFSKTGYIMYSPDMSPFTDKMSICSWLKDQTSDAFPVVFSYGKKDEFRFQSDGENTCMGHCGISVNSELTAQVTKGDWFHACLTWSTSSKSIRYYANGKLLGAITTDSRTLSTGYDVVIGNHVYHKNDPAAVLVVQFTGEIRNLNVYSKELTSEEIKRQAEAGMCSLNEDENEDVRVLKWEDMIKLPRTGSVTDLPTSQSCLQEMTTKLEETQRTLDNTLIQLNCTLEEKENISGRLQETQENLNTTLEEKERLSETLQETQENLNTTLEEKERISERLQETQENLNTTLEEKERISETLQETQENLNTTLEEKERISGRLQETQENLNTTLEEKKRLSETLQETQENLNTTLEEKERISETLQETQENLNTTLEEKEKISETLQETQENLNTTLVEKERLSETLQETQENLNSTQLELKKVSSNLTATMAELITL